MQKEGQVFIIFTRILRSDSQNTKHLGGFGEKFSCSAGGNAKCLKGSIFHQIWVTFENFRRLRHPPPPNWALMHRYMNIYTNILRCADFFCTLRKNVKIWSALAALLKLCANINFYIFCNKILKLNLDVRNWSNLIFLHSVMRSNLIFTYIRQFLRGYRCLHMSQRKYSFLYFAN